MRADTAVLCYALALAEFDRLDETNPKIKAVLLRNVLRHVSTMLRRLNLK